MPAAETDLWLAVHCEAEKAVVGLESRRVGPDRRILLPQQSGEARQDLEVQKNDSVLLQFFQMRNSHRG